MKRIQIIFLLLLALTVLSLVSGGEDSNYYSEYDTRFSCGLKYDINLIEIVDHKLNQQNSREELTSRIIQNGINTHSQKIQFKNTPGISWEIPLAPNYYSTSNTNFTSLTQDDLSPSRAPPVHS